SARLDGDRVARPVRLVDRALSNRSDVELGPIRMVGAGPPRARAVFGAHGERVVRRRAGLIGEQTFAVANGARADAREEEASGGEVPRRFARVDRQPRPLGASLWAEARRRVEV